MRLPQDRILHIDTELAGDEVRVIAEWQGELVRCKDCKWWYDNIGYSVSYCPWNEDVEIPDADDFCSYGERK